MFVHILGVPAVSTSSKTEGITLTFSFFAKKLPKFSTSRNGGRNWQDMTRNGGNRCGRKFDESGF
jgi:hypothetical protein